MDVRRLTNAVGAPPDVGPPAHVDSCVDLDGLDGRREVRGLAEMSETAARTVAAVADVGELVAGLPLIGDEATGVAGEVAAGGRDAVDAAGGAR